MVMVKDEKIAGSEASDVVIKESLGDYDREISVTCSS